MVRIPRELTDMIDVIRDRFERNDLRRSLPAHPAGIEHPAIEGRADDGSARNKLADLIIRQLPIARHQRTAIMMAGQHRRAKEIERLGHASIAQMRDIENHPEPLELLKQRDSGATEWSIDSSTERVLPLAVMCEPRGSQSQPPPMFKLAWLDDRIGTFHAQDHANWSGGIGRSDFPMRLEILRTANEFQLSLLLEKLVISELRMSRGIGQSRRGIIEIGALVRCLRLEGRP